MPIHERWEEQKPLLFWPGDDNDADAADDCDARNNDGTSGKDDEKEYKDYVANGDEDEERGWK